jgi:hypothetical protein
LLRTTGIGLHLGVGLALAAGLSLPMPAMAQKGGGVTITSLGHSALMIQGGGARVLLNPFQPVGCAAGLSVPRVSADVILASSLLKDEGAQVASGKFLVKPGSYRLAGLQIEGIGGSPRTGWGAAASATPPSGAGARAASTSPTSAAPPAGSAPLTACCWAARTC